jgi:formate hydrogenlyase subunit 4
MSFDLRLLGPVLGLMLAPLLVGVYQSVRARLAGRAGSRLDQPYRGLFKLAQKGIVLGPQTTWIYQSVPMVSLAAMVTALFLIPFGRISAPIVFSGDLMLLIALFTLARLSLLFGCLDCGLKFSSPSVGRQASLLVLVEPAIILALTAVSRISQGHMSLTGAHQSLTFTLWSQQGLVLLLVGLSLATVSVCQATGELYGRSLDDPRIDLTAEIDSIEHCGPDLAMIQYAKMLKNWILGLVLLNVLVPSKTHSIIPIPFLSTIIDSGVAIVGMLTLTILFTVAEFATARYRKQRELQLVIGANVVAALALALTIHPLTPT